MDVLNFLAKFMHKSVLPTAVGPEITKSVSFFKVKSKYIMVFGERSKNNEF